MKDMRSFVIADIPGLIEGAASGAGLGMQFLRHLSRTRLLMHIVDVVPVNPEHDPVTSIRIINKELSRYSESLSHQEQWLVLNKIDLVPEDVRQTLCCDIVERLNWRQNVFQVSSQSGEGCADLCTHIIDYLDNLNETGHKQQATSQAETITI